jgi:Mg2+-importing ATPase
MVSISTDNVDDEELLKPKKWKIDVIAKFGALLGSVGTIFDLILIVFLMGATLEVFRTGLFLEIILSEIVVLMILRSNRPFFLAEPPSAPLFITSVLSVLLGIAVIYTPVGQLFGFVPLEPRVLLFIIVVVIAYASLTEIVKLIYRKFFEPPLEIDEKALALLRKKIVPELH